MTVARDGNDPSFHFNTRSINGLLSLRLWRTDTKEVLWHVNLNYYRERRLKYGEIPMEFRTFNGGVNRASQSYPVRNQKPQTLPSSATFMVELVYQYDTWFAPSGQSVYFLFSTD
jgi:hypothetical protein